MPSPGRGRLRVAGLLCNLWRDALPRCPAHAHGIDLSLRRSPRLHRIVWLLWLMALGCMVELLLRHDWVAAALVALLAATGWSGCRGSRWRSLRLEVGRWLLTSEDGRVERVWVAPGSMRLGPHVLLVLRGASGTHRLLCGPDNLAAAQLAALRRSLPGGTASAVAGLHSVAAHGSKCPVPP